MVTNNSCDYQPTQYNVQTGGASGTLNNVAPSATSGVPLISQGSSSQPIFGTAVVAGGGTGDTSFTAYSVICGGTTSTGALQNVSGVGTSGFVLTSNGAGALPTWQSASANAFSSINVQTFTSSGTYTPTSGMLYCIIECVGGGGGGGGTANSAVGTLSIGAGGGGGAYSRKFASSSTIGSSQTVTVGGGGAGGTAGNNNGSNGTATSVGSICTANGGTGGGGQAGTNGAFSAGGAGGTAGTGDFSIPGQRGAPYFNNLNFSNFNTSGGNSVYGFGGVCSSSSTPATGTAGQNYGGGGSGGLSSNNGTAAGGAGAAGIVIITEFI